ncbi:MAG: hypothetical protein IJ317_05365 [Clostridia bacterium]|nr:hypothetical protein [Clostridia bacterium]
MGQLKNSQQMLNFLNDLSSFSHLFDGLKTATPRSDDEKKPSSGEKPSEKPDREKDEKNPRSPTQGIADDFIQQILDGYFKKG